MLSSGLVNSEANGYQVCGSTGHGSEQRGKGWGGLGVKSNLSCFTATVLYTTRNTFSANEATGFYYNIRLLTTLRTVYYTFMWWCFLWCGWVNEDVSTWSQLVSCPCCVRSPHFMLCKLNVDIGTLEWYLLLHVSLIPQTYCLLQCRHTVCTSCH